MLGKRASPVRREAVRKGPLWHLAGGPPYCPSGSDRGSPEKDPHHGHLAGGLPVWIWGVLAELEAAGLVTLADKGYQGSTYAKIPYKGKNKPESQKEANKAHAKLRSPGERANAQLKTWRILRKLRCCPWRAGQLAKAIHVLQVREA